MPRIGLAAALEALGGDRSRLPPEAEVLARVGYTMETPAMIGDFTGDTYKLIPAGRNRYEGAVLTGLPTAQALIGKARWLMRVAIATVTGAGSHRGAEEAAPVLVATRGGSLRLGLVELVFGSSNKRWRGLLTVQVIPVPGKSGFTARFGSSTGLMDAVKRAREMFSTDYFYEEGKTWDGTERKYRLPKQSSPYDYRGRNRFNSLLAVGSRVFTSGCKNVFIPKAKDGSYKFPDPVAPGRVLRGFRLTVLLDQERLDLVVGADRERAEWAVRLGVMALLAAPILLGLGKAANRGFGRFAPVLSKDSEAWFSDSEIKSFVEVLEAGDESMVSTVIERLAMAAARAAGVPRPARPALSGVPVLPVGPYKRYIISLSACDRSVEELLDIIGYAASKASWKMIAYGTLKRSARHMHSWPLGLPRKGKYVSKENGTRRSYDTGYVLDDGSEGRRQSMAMVFPYKGYVHVVAYPAGDLLGLHDRLIHKAICNPGGKRVKPCDDKPVRQIDRCIKIDTRTGRPVRERCEDPWSKVESAFQNLLYALEKLLSAG